MFARKNTLLNRSIVSNRINKFAKGCYALNVSTVILLFAMIFFSLPLYSDELPMYLRLKPDTQDVTLEWEQGLFSDAFSAEKKIGDGSWQKVQGLQKKVKVGVVLAGGVVRGIAHIGVLRALEENYIPIDGLSGTSMGSIIAGLYASGYSPDGLESIVKEDIDWETFFQDQQPRIFTPVWERIQSKPRPPALEIDLTWKPPFILFKTGSGIRIAQKFTDEIDDKTIKACYKAGFDFYKLPCPFGAMIVNLNSGKSELKVKGTLSTALRASSSIPVAFEPMTIGEEQYIDGGILDNLPVDAFLQEFDTLRKPNNIIKIHDEEKREEIFIIASYPSKLRGVRDTATRAAEETSGLIGIDVLNKSSCFAREFHVWNNWDNADGQIDIDVKGGFDFNENKLEELIDKGYYSAMIRIYEIKKELIRREASIDSLDKDREIFEVGSVKLFSVEGSDTLKVNFKEAKEVEKAVRFIEGSYIEKNDVCYALRNIYNTGDYKNVEAKINKKKRKLNTKFFLTKKDKFSEKIEVTLKMGNKNSSDSVLVAEKIRVEMVEEQRRLGFNEIEKIVENEYVNLGYVAPVVESAKYSKNRLTIHGDVGTKLNSVKIVIQKNSKKSSKVSEQEKDSLEEKSKQEKDKSALEVELEKEFEESLSPGKILKKNKEVYNKYQLRTIAVEGIKDDTLIIRTRPKTGHTIEFPALSFDKDQGINLFGEIRTKPIRGFGKRSFYVNYGQNFPVKSAREIPKGYSWNLGVNKYSPCYASLWNPLIVSFLPDISLGGRNLRYPGGQDTNLYDMQYIEYLNVNLSEPIYFFIKDCGFVKDLAFIVGGEFSWRKYSEDSLSGKHLNGFLRLEYDDLDRLVFPSSGFKISIGTVLGSEGGLWIKERAKGTFVKGFRIQNKVKTVFTGEFYESKCNNRTPPIEYYSMGGISPLGSYQLRLYDSEDLPCYPRNKFLEPYMLKFGGSTRLTLTEIEVLGLRLNLHFIGSFYAASTASSFFSPWECNKGTWYYSRSLGFYLDTSVLNIGLGWANTEKNFYHDIYLSAVLYGVGL